MITDYGDWNVVSEFRHSSVMYVSLLILLKTNKLMLLINNDVDY